MQLLFLRQWFSDDIMQAIGWTLIHSLWQGLLVAAVAAIIIISTRKTAASVRYNMLGIVMVLFLITTFITFGKQLNIAAITGSTDPSSPVVAAGEVFISEEAPAAVSTVSTSFMDTFVSWFNTHADLFVLGWMLFFFVNCLKLFTGIASVHRLRHYRTHPVTEEWKEKVEELSKMLGIRRSVSFLQSELVKVPVALGFLKPVILVPVGLITHLPAAQVETILLHELAHIRRRDYLVNVIQRFAEAIFFFNPALLWISSLMRQEREACCDDLVIAHTDHKRQYLDALVAFQEYSLNRSYAMAISSRRDYLLARVKRMLTRENKKLGLMEKLALVMGLLIFSAFTYLSREENAAEKADKAVKIELSNHPEVYSVSQTPSVPIQPQVTTRQPVPKDTVPRKKDAIRKMVEKPFKKFATTTTNKNGEETLMIEVTGSDDKRYIIIKENDRITAMHIDGKPVDPTLSEWTPLLEKINETLADKMNEQEAKYKEQLDLNEKQAEAVKQESIRQAEMKKIQDRHIEKERKFEQRTENLRQDFMRKGIRGEKLAQRMKDSVEAWGRQLKQEMQKLEDEMKLLQNKFRETPKDNGNNRIEKPRTEKNTSTRSIDISESKSISIERKAEKRHDQYNEKKEAILEVRKETNDMKKESKDVKKTDQRINIEKPRSGGRRNIFNANGDGNSNSNSNGNGNGNGNGKNNKNNDAKFSGALVQKANHDFENAIKTQLNENAHFEYNNAHIEYGVDAGREFQYKPGMPTAPAAPPPPANKAKPGKEPTKPKPKSRVFSKNDHSRLFDTKKEFKLFDTKINISIDPKFMPKLIELKSESIQLKKEELPGWTIVDSKTT